MFLGARDWQDAATRNSDFAVRDFTGTAMRYPGINI